MAQSKADSDAFQCGDSPHSNPNTNTTVQKEIDSGEGNKEAQGAPAEIEEHREGPPSDTATTDNRENDSKNKDRKEDAGSTKTESAVDALSNHSVSELTSTPTDAKNQGDDPQSNIDTEEDSKKDNEDGQTKQGENKEVQGTPVETEQHRDGPQSDTTTRTQDNREKHSENEDKKEETKQKMSSTHSDETSREEEDEEKGNKHAERKEESGLPKRDTRPSGNSSSNNDDKSKDEIIVHPPETIQYADSLHPDPNINTNVQRGIDSEGATAETGQRGDSPPSDTATRTQDNREEDSKNEDRKEDAGSTKTESAVDASSSHSVSELTSTPTDAKNQGDDPQSNIDTEEDSKKDNEDGQTKQGENKEVQGAPVETEQHGDGPQSDTTTRTQDNREKHSENEDRKEETKQKMSSTHSDETSREEEDGEKGNKHAERKEDSGLPKRDTRPSGNSSSNNDDKSKDKIIVHPPETIQYADSLHLDPNTNTNVQRGIDSEGATAETGQRGDSPPSDTATRTQDNREEDSKNEDRKEDAGSTKTESAVDALSSHSMSELTSTPTDAKNQGDDPQSNTNIEDSEDGQTKQGENKEVQGTPVETEQHRDGHQSDKITRTQDNREKHSENEERKEETKQKMSSTHFDETSREEEDGERKSEHEDRKEDAGSTERDSAVHASSSHSMTSNEYKAEDIIDNRGVDPSVTKPRKTSFVGETETRADTDNRDHARHQESPHDTASPGVSKEREKQSILQNDKMIKICGAIIVLLLPVVLAVLLYIPDSTPPVQKEFDVVDKFNQEMETVQSSFPNQRPELWKRSLIHLRRHLKTANPTEPVSLILTSGHGAERTLGCLAQRLAKAFSAALNSSHLDINGKSTTSQNSDRVKMDIDSNLKKAFENKKRAAVIHHFEELPPGSTLIFYRYCDHENAAYKKVFLAFTVMLDAGVEDPSNASLGRVEEMVQEHLQHKFVSSDKAALFNEMDVDKLSGLWSRISHLILPVAAEENIEQQGCGA